MDLGQDTISDSELDFTSGSSDYMSSSSSSSDNESEHSISEIPQPQPSVNMLYEQQQDILIKMDMKNCSKADSPSCTDSDMYSSSYDSDSFSESDSNSKCPVGEIPKVGDNASKYKQEGNIVKTTTSRVAGRKLEVLVAPTRQSGNLEWVVKFEDKDGLDLVAADLIHQHFPERVIRYLEKRLVFNTEDSLVDFMDSEFSSDCC